LLSTHALDDILACDEEILPVAITTAQEFAYGNDTTAAGEPLRVDTRKLAFAVDNAFESVHDEEVID
jgi:hypothetical protein